MQEWKLPSQLITTDRQKNELIESFFLRHETMRRLQAESDLISALDLLDSPAFKDNKEAHDFKMKFLDKTINN